MADGVTELPVSPWFAVAAQGTWIECPRSLSRSMLRLGLNIVTPYPKGLVYAQMLEVCDQVEAFARCLLSGVFDAENTWVRSRRDKINDSDVLK